MKRLALIVSCCCWVFPLLPAALPNEPYTQQPPLHGAGDAPPLQHRHITQDQLDDLTSLAALEDVAYCVPSPGISDPFSCPSRCAQFPDIELVSTWSTGLLLTDSSGFLALDHAQRRVVVAFRGTYSLGDVIADLSTNPQHYVPYIRAGDEGCDNCMVHAGFLSSWLNTAPTVNQLLKDARREHPDFTLEVLGHSLGGALALLAVLDFVAHGHENLRVTTFGQPKVGNQALAAYVDRVLVNEGKLRRITRRSDPVPLLPLTEWDYYPHAGELFINKDSLELTPEDVLVCSGDADLDCSAFADYSLHPDPESSSHSSFNLQAESNPRPQKQSPWTVRKQRISKELHKSTANATFLDLLTSPFIDLSQIPNLPPPHHITPSTKSKSTNNPSPLKNSKITLPLSKRARLNQATSEQSNPASGSQPVVDSDSRPIADSQLESRFATESFDISQAVQDATSIPARYKLWELFFAHRDYFVRMGLCLTAPSLGLPDIDIPGFGRGDGGHGEKSAWTRLKEGLVSARQDHLWSFL